MAKEEAFIKQLDIVDKEISKLSKIKGHEYYIVLHILVDDKTEYSLKWNTDKRIEK